MSSKSVKLIIFAFSIVLLTGVSYLYLKVALHRKNTLTESKVVTIEVGMSTSQIGGLLQKEKLINSGFLFTLYTRYKGYVLEAGTYDISGDSSLVDVVGLLRFGRNDVKLTIVEGLRAEEIAEHLSKSSQNFNSEEFLNLIIKDSLEGFLYPDTYFVKKDITAKELIKLLTDTYKVKTQDSMKNNTTGLTEKEVLTLASIVEREEPDAAERPVVAGILFQRFNAEELLGADATTQYVFGKAGNWWPKNLTAVELDSGSPYNTRKVAGLPPAPICSPGISAIQSVLNYKKTEFRYYLHDKYGKIHYAKTNDEQTANQYRYLQN